MLILSAAQAAVRWLAWRGWRGCFQKFKSLLRAHTVLYKGNSGEGVWVLFLEAAASPVTRLLQAVGSHSESYFGPQGGTGARKNKVRVSAASRRPTSAVHVGYSVQAAIVSAQAGIHGPPKLEDPAERPKRAALRRESRSRHHRSESRAK